MKYISTRGSGGKKKFTEILLEGLAKDGGLYLPEKYPQITAGELTFFRKLNYAQLAFEIFKKFEFDIPDKDLKMICEKSYKENIFIYTRKQKKIKELTPIIELEKNLYLQELSNGPTLAFKDIAMQLLGNLFEYILEKKNINLNILGATSGDTGSAAEYALLGKKRVKVFMLSPLGKMSEFQRAQMYTLDNENIFNLAVKGLFDDAQDVVKKVSMDEKFKKKYKIGAVNSINWARIIAQVVYYINGYLLVTKNNNELVNFSVPTGNFGDICAGHIARMMGLPIKNLILATNENDVLDEFFKTGIYRPRKSSETFITSSPSMDISKASNFERFVFDLVDRKPEEVKKLWLDLEKNGFFDLSKTAYFAKISEFGFISGKSTEQNRMKTIKDVYKKYNIYIDTHTADAMKVALEYRDKNIKTIVLETAQAIKFEESIFKSLGKKISKPGVFKKLEKLPQKVYICEPDAEIIKEFIKSKIE